jgi:hypothetical protein
MSAASKAISFDGLKHRALSLGAVACGAPFLRRWAK